MTNAIATLSAKTVFFLGVNTGYVTDGLPDERYIEFYRRRSSPALHCAIVGNVVVSGGHPSNVSTPVLSSDRVWSKVADAISERGSLPGIQLATAWEGYVGTRRFVGTDAADVIPAGRRLVSDLGSPAITAILDAFEAATRMSIDHGFEHVQLHGAHGYLLNLLLDERINPMAEYVLDRLSKLATLLTVQHIESSIRISLRTGDATFDADGADAFHDRIAELPFDYVDLSSGFYNIDKRLIYPSRPSVLIERLDDSVAVARRNSSRKFILSGRAMRNEVGLLPSNIHVGLCRDLIANPGFLSEPHNGCRNRNKCHYFSRGEDHLVCALWDGDEGGLPGELAHEPPI